MTYRNESGLIIGWPHVNIAVTMFRISCLLALFLICLFQYTSAQSDSLKSRLDMLKTKSPAVESPIAKVEGSSHKEDSLPRMINGKVVVHSSRGIDSLEKSMRGVQRLEGFRIQVFLGSYREAMEARRKFSESGLGYTSYALPNTPDYMVLVGDFRTRFESQKALKEIKKSYPGAFILPSLIEPPQLGGKR